MQPTGLRDSQLRDSNNQKVHPQPMEDSATQNPEAVEAFVSKIFTNISSLKSAYIELQAAHTPYDPEKIQAADKLVISELKKLSELKHFYRENNPKPPNFTPQDSRLAAEIQEQQSLLKTYEVMVKKFQSEIQNKDSKVLQLQQNILEAAQTREKLEKNLKLRGLSSKDSWGLAEGPTESTLTFELFKSAVGSAYRAIHDFSKPLISMMKAAGWDLDAAANSIEPNIAYAKRAHKKYAFESHICQKMFIGFQQENFNPSANDGIFTTDSEFLSQIPFFEGDRSIRLCGSKPGFRIRSILPEQVLARYSPNDGGFFFWELRPEGICQKRWASADTILPSVPEISKNDLAFAQVGSFF